MTQYFRDGDIYYFVVKVEDGVAMNWNYRTQKWESTEEAKDVAADIYSHVEIGDGDAKNIIREYSKE